MEFRIKPNTLGTRVTLVRHAALVTELCEALITKLTIGSSKPTLSQGAADMGNESELLIKTVTKNMRKLLTRMNQKVSDQVVSVNGTYNSTRSITGRKVGPKLVMSVHIKERGKPYALCNSRNQTARNGDSAEGRGCGKKQMPHRNNEDRVNSLT